jgi:hypothetical protein
VVRACQTSTLSCAEQAGRDRKVYLVSLYQKIHQGCHLELMRRKWGKEEVVGCGGVTEGDGLCVYCYEMDIKGTRNVLIKLLSLSLSVFMVYIAV